MTLPTIISIKYRNKGFTLIEMLIVMTILVAMLSVAAPYAKHSNKKMIAVNEALNLKELINYAIDKSRYSNSVIRLVHSQKERAYWLEYSDIQNQDQFQEFDNQFGVTHFYDKSIQSIVIESTEQVDYFKYIEFDPRKELPSNISIQINTINCWAKIKLNQRSIEVSNGSI